MRVFLELIRIVFIVILVGGIAFFLLNQIYADFSTAFDWLGTLGIFLFLFLFYRNKLQFTGWYRGNKTALKKRTTMTISLLAAACMLLPFLAGQFI